MKCLSPIGLKKFDKSYQGIDNFMYVPCGQCIACRLNYAKYWSIRMMQELRKHDSACFATLTYDDDHLPEDHLLHKRDLQLFWKKLRKERHVRYFCCGEYGDTFGRPHYHAIIYGVSPQETELIQKYWDHGFIKLGTVTEDSCNYVAKYMTKKLRGRALEEMLQQDPNYQNEFVLMSRRPGIGGDLDEDMQRFIRENGFIYRKGYRSSLPRYYKDKFNIDVMFGKPEEYDHFIKRLTDYDKIDKVIRKGLDFFKGVKK